MELVYMDGKKEPYTTSEIIAEVTKVQNQSITKLVDNNIARFSSLGMISKVKQSKAVGRPKKVYKLNEAQTYLVISLQRNLTRNSEVVGNCKEIFAKAYHDLKAMVNRRYKQSA